MDKSADTAAAVPIFERVFVRRALAFAKRACGLGLWPGIWLVSLAVAIVAIVSGAFQTRFMPWPQRSLFWLVLMMWQAFKWSAWFVWRVRSKKDWWPAALIGSLPLNLMLPLEIWACYAVVGFRADFSPAAIWVQATAIFGALMLVLLWRYPVKFGKVAPPTILESNRISIEDVQAVTAEDHYCRIHLRGGMQSLVHARFADLVGELGVDRGTQIHRGSWVADAAVAQVRRNGRAWEVQIQDGTTLRVSETFRKIARDRGMLGR
ncbi:MAG: LytTR family DNA-binding domain-containing protein [Erythrobacter sp.]